MQLILSSTAECVKILIGQHNNYFSSVQFSLTYNKTSYCIIILSCPIYEFILKFKPVKSQVFNMIRHYSKISSRSSSSSCKQRSSRRRIRQSIVPFGILLVGLLFVLVSLLITLPSAVVVATATTTNGEGD